MHRNYPDINGTVVMRYKDLSLGIFVMAIWGVNFIAIKVSTTNLNPLLVTALRFTLAAIPAIFFIPKPPVAWRYILSYSLVFGTGIWGLATCSLTAGLSPGMASLLLQLNAAISVLLGWLILKETVSAQKILGASLAILGLWIAFLIEDGSVSPLGVVLVILAATCWGISGLIVKAANTKEVFAFIVWSLLFAPIPLLVLALALEGKEVLNNLIKIDKLTLASILFQAWPTTLLGYWIWNRLVVIYPLSTIAPLTLLVPIFGLLASWLVYQEPLGIVKICSSLLIISGLIAGVIKWDKVKLSKKKQANVPINIQ
ncbi:EamA family transporter [Microbulbifer sp. DLAB2-AA]|uniref:EamA family transporter n=1 Tax=Microbulbifer sp. DLAB2-AA TaxID=3243394 RepID=UPI00403927DD